MAIDTAAKRKSVSGVVGTPLLPGVTPDSSKGREWRQASGWGYIGVPGDEPAAGVGRTVTGTWEVPSLTGTWEVPE